MKRAILTCALVLIGLACAARPRVEAPAATDGQESPELEGQPVRPRLLNPDELDRTLQREYPPRLKERGIGGTTIVWVFIDEKGVVRNQRVKDSSGREEFDAAALGVVQVARFSPARNRDEAVALWISMEITFVARQVPRSDGARPERAG